MKEDKIYLYIEDKQSIKIEIEKTLIKWSIDIVEDSKADLILEERRRLKIYSEKYQSFYSFLTRPWLESIPKNLHQEISQIIRNNYQIKDLETSYTEMLDKRFHYWAPASSKQIFSNSSRESAQEYYDLDFVILLISIDYTNPFNRTYKHTLIEKSDVLNKPSLYPRKLIEYTKMKYKS